MSDKQTERRDRMLAKLRTIRHGVFGQLSVDPEPGTVFDPLPWFMFGGFLDNLLAYFRYRASRSGIGDGLPKHLRLSALDDAAQTALADVLDRDYEADGITGPEIARAVLTTIGRMKRNGWRAKRAGAEHVQWFPYNRAQDSRTANPAAIVAAVEPLPEVVDGMSPMNALTGHGTDETKAHRTNTPGGRCRPRNHGKMRPERIVRQWVERVPFVSVDTLANGGGVAEKLAMDCERVVQGWTMVRGYGKSIAYHPAQVWQTLDGIHTQRFSQHQPPQGIAWADDGGPVCGLHTRRRCVRRPVCAADREAHREALAAHAADRPLISGNPRRVRIMARLRLRAMLLASS
jgi:hypothetical protein